MSVSWPTIILPRPVPRVLESTTTSSTWPARWGGWSCREQARVLRVLAMPLVPPPGTERVQAARERAKKAGEPNGKHRGDGLTSGLGGPQQPTAAYAAARSNTWPASPSAPVPTQRPPWMNLCSTTRVAHASTSGSPSFRSAGLSRSNTMMCSLSRLRWRDAKGYSSS